MRHLLLAILIAIPQLTHAKLQGKPRMDSLLRELPGAKNDTDKVSLLGRLSLAYKAINPEEGLKYGQQAWELAKGLGWKKGQAIALGQIGANYEYKADYANALDHIFRALKINEEINNKRGIGANLSTIGVIYQDQGNYPKALEFFSKSLKINELIKDSINMAGNLGNIGILYSRTTSDYAKALDYESRSLDIFKKLGDKAGVAHNLGNIGALCHKHGNYAKALEYDFQALEIFETLGDKSNIAINLGNIGETYLSIAQGTDTEPGQQGIGPAAKLKPAIGYLEKAIQVSNEISDLESMMEFATHLSDAYALAGNYSEALKQYKRYAAIKDSVYSTDSKLKIAKLEAQRELQIKTLEIAKKRSEQMFLIVVTILLLIIIGIGLRKYIAQHKYNKQLAKEKKRHLARIAEQTSVLSQIAHTQSHEVSGQVATILGLAALFNTENPADPDNKVAIEGIAEVSAKLDKIVKGMVIKENSLNKNA